MNGFETFLYNLGAVVFAASVPAAMFWVVGKIEQPRRKRK